MSNDPIGNSVASETDSSDPISPKTNYSRWMTDMAADIAHLKMHQLAIPGAHNSGVDMAGTWGPEELWGANQNKSFPEQLAAGARHLDLRLVDSSYTKTSGRNNPTTKFYEVFEFKHGFASAGRRLEHLINDVKNFIIANPLEIVFLDFHKYDRGRHSHNSLERCLLYFNSIKDFLIPRSAADLSIAEIRKIHPRRSVVLFFDHGTPDEWKTHMWGSLDQQWNPEDSSDQGIETLVSQSMSSPPLIDYWALSASVYSSLGPKHLNRHHPVRTETFKEGFQNSKIVMVDFIERTDTVVSVVDNCISLNKRRSTDTTAPTTPLNLIVKQLPDGENEGEDYQNTVEFQWEGATDNLGVYKYQVFQNDSLFFTASKTRHTVKNIRPIPYTYKVTAMDIVGNTSGFSDSFYLKLPDNSPPTIPEQFEFARVGLTIADLQWKASHDFAGIDGYEIRCNGKVLGYTANLTYSVTGLIRDAEYTFEVRAKDVNELYSEYTKLVLEPRPGKLENLKQTIIKIDFGENSTYNNLNKNGEIDFFYVGLVYWDAPFIENIRIAYKYKLANGETQTLPYYYMGPKAGFVFLTYPLQIFRFEIWIELLDTRETTEHNAFNYVFDITPPAQPANLYALTHKVDETTLTWSHSVGATEYAISINEEPPTYLPAASLRHSIKGLPLDETYLVELWAIDARENVSTVESITLDTNFIPPDKPGNPIITEITGTSAKLNWVPPLPNPPYYLVTVNNATPVRTSSSTFRLKELQPETNHDIEIRAISSAGRISEPAFVNFTTPEASPPSKPGPLVITDNTASTVDIHWTPSSDNIAVTGYELTLNSEAPINIPSNRHTLTGLKEAASYTIEVRAFDAAGNTSEPSSASFVKKDLTPPTRPGTPVVSNVSLTSAEITWTKSSDNNNLKGYKISLYNEAPITLTDNKYTFAELKEGTSYTIEVRAFDSSDNLSASSTASFRTKLRPISPTQLKHTALTSSSVKLSWLPGSDDERVVGYQVSRNGTPLRMVEGTSYDANWLSPNRDYLFEVRTKDNDEYLSDPRQLEITTLQAPPPPGPVRNLRLSGSISNTLTWRPPETGAAIQYIVSRDDQFWAATPVSPNPLCLIEMPPAGQAYLYEVRARNIEGQFSDRASIRIGTVVPASLQAINLTNTSFTLTWEIPSGSVGVTGYQVSFDDATPFTVAETQYTFAELNQGSTYTITVRSQYDSGELSDPASLTVFLLGDLPSAPSNFRYKYVLARHILEWNAPSNSTGISGYNIILTGPQGTSLNYKSIEPTLSPLLLLGTRYDVKITAVNAAGESLPLISEMSTG